MKPETQGFVKQFMRASSTYQDRSKRLLILRGATYTKSVVHDTDQELKMRDHGDDGTPILRSGSSLRASTPKLRFR